MHPIKIVINILLFTATFFSQQSLIKNYTAVDGLPISTIYDCVQASDGNLWFASEGGLIEYDGQTWVLYDSLGGHAANFARSFVDIDYEKNLWVFPKFTNDSILYLNNGEWKSIKNLSDIAHTYVAYDIELNKDGTGNNIVLAVNSPFLFLSVDGSNSFEQIILPNTNYINDVKFFNNRLLLATDQGLFDFDYIGKKFGPNLIPQNIPIYYIDTKSEQDQIYILSDKWIGTFENENLKILIQNLDFQFYNDHINMPFLRKIPNGEFLFGTIYQLLSYSPFTKSIRRMDEDEDSFTLGATSIFIDYEKNTWITTFRGIKKIKYSPFATRIIPDKLFENEVTSISKFPDGPLVLGHNGSLTLFDEKQNNAKTISLDNFQTDEFSRILYSQYHEKNDLIWFNSQVLGIGTLSRGGILDWVIQTNRNNRKSIASFYINENNICYYAMPKELYEIISINVSQKLLDHNLFYIRQITDYDDDNLLIASKYGLYIYNTQRKELEGYSYNGRNKNNIYCVHRIDDINWLVGSYGGLLVFNGKELREFPDLKIDVPIFFIGRENDHIWFGLMGGALRWNPTTGEQKMFTIKEGLAGVETNRDAFLFDDNKVYIGTENGLSIFLPEAYHPEYYKIKPKINFIGITDLKGVCYSIDKELDFSYSNNDILVKYISPSFIDETSMNYTVVLSNIDENTTEAFNTTETSYYIRNLASDTYRVGISAINPNGISSDTVYSANIVIRPPFYLETWFFSLVLIFSISVTYSIYNYIMKVRYSKILQQKVDERTAQLRQSEISIRELTQRVFTAQEEQSEKIARDLHDHIAQDMALIQLEIEKILKSSNNNNDKNHAWLTDKVAELTSYMRDLAYFLHPNTVKQTGFVNSVQSLCKDFCSHSNIEIEFFSNLEQSFSITDEAATNIYRVIQEGLWNIRKHSGANSGIVIVLQRDKSLIVRIEDDGKGFEVESTINNPVKKSMGLRSMGERIIYLKGEFSIKSVLTEGTKLKATIPLAALNQSIPDTNLDQPSGS